MHLYRDGDAGGLQEGNGRDVVVLSVILFLTLLPWRHYRAMKRCMVNEEAYVVQLCSYQTEHSAAIGEMMIRQPYTKLSLAQGL